MKKLFFIICIGMLVFSCEQDIHITQPIILIKTNSPEVNDTIEISLVELAEIGGERILPDYYIWEILDEGEIVCYSDFPNSSSITWIPDSVGYFLIRLQIGYDNNKSLTVLKEITIANSVKSLQSKLIGKWKGRALTMFGLSWNVSLSFDSTGHYVGKAEEISDSTYWPIGPFYFGYYLIDNYDSVTWLPDLPEPVEAPGSPLYRQTPQLMSEDIPCTLFEIKEIKENKGSGDLTIGSEYEIWGNPYEYDCTMCFKIENLIFFNEGNSLYFTLVEPGDDYNEWYMEYNLTRSE